jgi:hypothetical protein
VKGQGYVFNLQAQDQVTDWNAVLELVGTNSTTGDVDLLAISDDEGVPGTGWSQMFFIAPASGVYSLRISGFDVSDTSDYVLTSKTCTPGLPAIADSLVLTAQVLTTFDCVLEQPFYNYFGSEDSSYTKFYTVHFNPNDTKRITVTYGDFFPAFQIFGPDWGVYCYYDYQGCGGDATNYGGEIKVGPSGRKVAAGGSSSISLTLTADGAFYCRSFSDFCGYNNFPGDYTIAVGAENFGDVGNFSLTVEPITFESDVQTVVRNKQTVIPAFNPVLNHLRVQPQKLHPRVRRTAASH